MDKIGEVIGPKGKVINAIQQRPAPTSASTTTAWSAR
jgi:polyribonucleotide nucleotidyltransferase